LVLSTLDETTFTRKLPPGGRPSGGVPWRAVVVPGLPGGAPSTIWPPTRSGSGAR
jgi:hypothetical protein